MRKLSALTPFQFVIEEMRSAMPFVTVTLSSVLPQSPPGKGNKKLALHEYQLKYYRYYKACRPKSNYHPDKE